MMCSLLGSHVVLWVLAGWYVVWKRSCSGAIWDVWVLFNFVLFGNARATLLSMLRQWSSPAAGHGGNLTFTA